MAISFKDAALEQLLVERSSSDFSPGLVAKRDLERFYWLLKHESSLPLSTPEFNLICDAWDDIGFRQPWDILGLANALQDAMEHRNLARKWGVAESDLLAKLASATIVQRINLADRVERFKIKAKEEYSRYLKNYPERSDPPVSSQD